MKIAGITIITIGILGTLGALFPVAEANEKDPYDVVSLSGISTEEFVNLNKAIQRTPKIIRDQAGNILDIQLYDKSLLNQSVSNWGSVATRDRFVFIYDLLIAEMLAAAYEKRGDGFSNQSMHKSHISLYACLNVLSSGVNLASVSRVGKTQTVTLEKAISDCRDRK